MLKLLLPRGLFVFDVESVCVGIPSESFMAKYVQSKNPCHRPLRYENNEAILASCPPQHLQLVPVSEDRNVVIHKFNAGVDLIEPSIISFSAPPSTGIFETVNERGNHVVHNLRIFKQGTLKDSKGVQRTWESSHLDDMVNNFHMLRQSGKFVSVPWRVDHSTSVQSVVGYFDDVHRDTTEPSFLAADVEFTEPSAYEKWQRGTFRARSVEVGMYETNEGATHYPVVMGCAFVDVGAIEGLYSRAPSGVASSIQVITDEQGEGIVEGQNTDQGAAASAGGAATANYSTPNTAVVSPPMHTAPATVAQQAHDIRSGATAGPGGTSSSTHSHLHAHSGAMHSAGDNTAVVSPPVAGATGTMVQVHSHPHSHNSNNLNHGSSNLSVSHAHQHGPGTPPLEPIAAAHELASAGVQQFNSSDGSGVMMFRLGDGEVTTDFARVQQELTVLSTFRDETVTSGRTAFVESLAQHRKIAAPQVDSMTALVLSMNDTQFAAFRATYETAPAATLFDRHGVQGDTNSPAAASAPPSGMSQFGLGTGGSDVLSDEERDKEVFRNLERSGMTQEQLEKTSVYKRLHSTTNFQRPTA